MKRITLLTLVLASLSQISLAHDYDKAVKANNQFGFNFYKAIREQDGKVVQNRFVSPVSAYFALSMLANGARTETEAAIYRTIQAYGLSREELNRSGKDLLTLLNKPINSKNPTKLEIANSVWSDKGFRFQDSYVETLKSVYEAEARNLDFTDPKSATVINQWVSDKTHGKIKKIVGDTLSDVFYLINTTYFKAPWQYPFLEENTKKKDFVKNDGTKTVVDMMHGMQMGRYAKTGNYEVAEIRYGETSEASLLILLPTTNLSALEDLLTEETYLEAEKLLAPNSSEYEITLSLPKFKFEYSANLNAPLSDMGMGIAFGPLADFRDMASGIVVSNAVQKTFLAMNEIGTEAAAATMIAGTTSVPMYPKVALNLDRPFAIVIKDNRSNAILFIGTVADPVL